MCLCVCVGVCVYMLACVCERDRERKRETESVCERKRERDGFKEAKEKVYIYSGRELYLTYSPNPCIMCTDTIFYKE